MQADGTGDRRETLNRPMIVVLFGQARLPARVKDARGDRDGVNWLDRAERRLEISESLSGRWIKWDRDRTPAGFGLIGPLEGLLGSVRWQWTRFPTGSQGELV